MQQFEILNFIKIRITLPDRFLNSSWHCVIYSFFLMVFKRKTTVLNCSILLRNDLLPLESQLCIFILLGLFWLTHFWLDWWMNIAMLLIELWAWAEMVLDHHRSSMMRCPLKDADSVNPRGGVGHRRLWSMSLLLIFCHIMIILYLCCNKLSLLDIILKAPRLVFILILYLSNSTKQQILGRQWYLIITRFRTH